MRKMYCITLESGPGYTLFEDPTSPHAEALEALGAEQIAGSFFPVYGEWHTWGVIERASWQEAVSATAAMMEGLDDSDVFLVSVNAEDE